MAPRRRRGAAKTGAASPLLVQETSPPRAERRSRAATTSEVPRFNAVLGFSSTLAGRSSFMVAFAYYELARQSGAHVERTAEYVTLLLGAFTCGVVCNMLLGASIFFCRRAHVRDVEQLRKDYFPMGFCKRGGGPVNWATHLFKAGFAMYLVAIGLMAHNYNPGAGSMEYALKGYEVLVLLALMLATTWRFRRLRNQAWSGELDAAVEAWTSDVPEVADLRRFWDIDSIGSRAMMMLGFVQMVGAARYIYIPYGDPWEALPNLAYWIFLRVASVFLIATVILTTECSLLFSSISSGKEKLIDFVKFQCRRMEKALWWCFGLGMYFVLLASAFTAYGCSCPCSDSSYSGAVGPCPAGLAPGGHCYRTVGLIPFGFCIGATALLLYQRFLVRQKVDRARQVTSKCAVGHDDTAQFTSSAADLTSSAAMIAGFTLYNLGTFDTDVIRGPLPRLEPSNPEDWFGLTGWGLALAIAIWGAYAFGIATVLAIHTIEWALDDIKFEGSSCRQAFLDSVKSSLGWIRVSFCAALACFVASFALFCLAKIRPAHLEPMIVVGMMAPFLAAEMWYARMQFMRVRDLPDEALPPEPENAQEEYWEDALGNVHVNAAMDRRTSQLAVVSGPAVLLMCFAYNAVMCFWRPRAALASGYLMLMGLSFSSGAFIAIAGNNVNMYKRWLDHDRRRQTYYIACLGGAFRRFTYSFHFLFYCFVCALVVMGFVKTWEWTSDEEVNAPYSSTFGWLHTAGGCATLAGMGYSYYWISELHWDVSTQKKGREGEREGKGSLQDIKHVVSAVTFQVGNVFFEMLFGFASVDDDKSTVPTGRGPYPWATLCYFGFKVLAFVCGVLCLFSGAQMLLWNEEFEDTAARSRFTHELEKRGYKRASLILYLLTSYFWMCSMLFLATVKYPQFYYLSVVWTLSGLTFASLGLLYIGLASERHRLRCDSSDIVAGARSPAQGDASIGHAGRAARRPEELPATGLSRRKRREQKGPEDEADPPTRG